MNDDLDDDDLDAIFAGTAEHGHVCETCGATWLHYEVGCKADAYLECYDCVESAGVEDDDALQQCECLRGCTAEAYELCPHCLRWLCQNCQDAGHHGCETTVDEQYRDRAEHIRALAGRSQRWVG